jgi:hypothetical protein
MSPEQKEAFLARQQKWRSEHPEHKKTKKVRRRRRNSMNHEKINAVARKRRAEHHKEYHEYLMEYKAKDVNSYGVPKSQIRVQSGNILDRIHSKLQGYEIHHCFSYDDPNKFIYIPRTLHLQIHQLLRDKNISAEANHWNAIRDLVNSCGEYTYIRC